MYLFHKFKYTAQTTLNLISLCYLLYSGVLAAHPQAESQLTTYLDDEINQSKTSRALTPSTEINVDAGISKIYTIFEQQMHALEDRFLEPLYPSELDYSVDLLHSLSFDILVSAGMAENLLTKIFAEAHYHQANIIVKGLLPNQTLAQTMSFWRQYAIKHTPPVNVFIDPIAFEAVKAELVPMLVAKVNDRQIATVVGVYSIDWFTKHIARKLDYANHVQVSTDTSNNQSWLVTDVYHLGHHGPSMAVLESNLIDQMQQKLAQIDWEDKKKRAYENFWFNLPSMTFPSAVVCQAHYIDPKITLNEPLLNEKGEILISKETEINPLDYLPFKQQLIIFNPTRSEEKDTIRDYLNQLERSNRLKNQRITLIATHFLPQTAWQMLEALENEFRMPVYRLTEAIQIRFNIMATPTLVLQEGDQFKVQSGCL